MSLNWPKPNHNHASEYQVAGWPFVTSSITDGTTKGVVTFPQVTQWFQVRNSHASLSLRVGFTADGVDGTNYLLIGPSLTDGTDGMTPVYNIKCKELWVRADTSGAATYSIIAGLTNVTGSEFPALGASNGFVGT